MLASRNLRTSDQCCFSSTSLFRRVHIEIFNVLFYYDKFSRKSNRAKSIAYKKSKPLNRHNKSNGKQNEDESQDLVSFAFIYRWFENNLFFSL